MCSVLFYFSIITFIVCIICWILYLFPLMCCSVVYFLICYPGVGT